MRRFVLDTGVLGAYLVADPIWKKMVADHRLDEDDAQLIASIVSHGELISIALRNNWASEKCKKLEAILEAMYVADINHGDPELLETYAKIDTFSYGALKSKPLPSGAKKMGKNDLWIAATASVVKATLLTMDVDYDHLNGQFITVAKYPRK